MERFRVTRMRSECVMSRRAEPSRAEPGEKDVELRLADLADRARKQHPCRREPGTADAIRQRA